MAFGQAFATAFLNGLTGQIQKRSAEAVEERKRRERIAETAGLQQYLKRQKNFNKYLNIAKKIQKLGGDSDETKQNIAAKERPIVIITSNNEKDLPDAFLRRCFFHYIQFPDRPTMEGIVKVHYPKIKKALVKDALDLFFDVRKIPGMKKKPSTSELIDWLKLLMSDELPDEILKNADTSKAIPPLYGALLKNEQDVQLLERLAFMSRREQTK